MNDEHINYADPETIPKGIDQDTKKRLKTYLAQKKKQDSEAKRTSNKVTKGMCDLINDMYEDRASPSEITEFAPVSSPNTIYYHLRGDCSHEYRSIITYSECGWMRVKAHKGMSTSEISSEYNVSERVVISHVTGDCGHEDGIEPLGGDMLYENSLEGPSMTTSTCPVCGDEFKHRSYRDRTTCSSQCNVQYAADKSAEKRVNGD